MNKTDEHIVDIYKKYSEVNVSEYDDAFLTNTLQKRIVESGCNSVEEYIHYLSQNELESKILIDSLQVSYSSFFRNPLTYNVMEKLILPTIAERKKHIKNNQLRIWSAACASGQEAYSIAMILEELKKCNDNQPCYRIFATDRDENQINMARKGHYHASALDNVNLKKVNKWFRRLGEIYSVKQELKKYIDFSVFDLLDTTLSCPPSSIFGGFDIIFCANVLFYYKASYRKIIINKMAGALAKDGYLITGETEREILLNNHFREIYPHSAIFTLR